MERSLGVRITVTDDEGTKTISVGEALKSCSREAVVRVLSFALASTISPAAFAESSDECRAAWDAIDEKTQETLRSLGIRPSHESQEA